MLSRAFINLGQEGVYAGFARIGSVPAARSYHGHPSIYKLLSTRDGRHPEEHNKVAMGLLSLQVRGAHRRPLKGFGTRRTPQRPLKFLMSDTRSLCYALKHVD